MAAASTKRQMAPILNSESLAWRSMVVRVKLFLGMISRKRGYAADLLLF